MPEPTQRNALALIESLSPRRREILDLIARGLGNDEIADELTISPATVRTQVTAILAHLGMKNRTEAAALVLNHTRPASPEAIARFVARPALAVLPTQVAADAHADLASAISQELGALFARCTWFPVLSRASMLGVRALGGDATELGKSVGARFLVDPHLRAAPDGGWRLTVEVTDAELGHVLWTDRFEFAREPFAVIDEVCADVVARAYPVMHARIAAQTGALGRAGHSSSTVHPDLDAWQLAYRAADLQSQRDRAGNQQADLLITRTLAREPTLVIAHYVRGLAAYDAILNQWVASADGRRHLLAAADACLTHAPHAAEGDFLLGRYHQTLGDHASAALALESAIAKNPSFAAAHALLAQTHMLCGDPDLALVRMQHALRLGPRSYVAGLATLHFAAGRFDEAAMNAERAIALTPRYPYARALAAVCTWALGRHAAAREHLRLLREACPTFDAEAFLATFGDKVPAVVSFSEIMAALSRPP